MQNVNNQLPAPAEAQYGGRILIARHHRPLTSHDNTKTKRTAKACTNCRKRKTKCTGKSPACNECQTNHLECVYESGRRDQVKRLASHKHLLLDLVRDLATSVGEADKAKIRDALQAMNEGSDPDTHMANAGEASHDTHLYMSSSSSTTQKTSEHGQKPSNDSNEENFPEITLLRECDTKADRQPSAANPPAKTVSNRTLWLGDLDVEVDRLVQPSDMPFYDEATELFRLYMDTVHDWLPILPAYFEGQVRRYYQHPFEVNTRWKAILNLVFAIAARYRHLTRSSDPFKGGTGDSHVAYMSRAMQLLAIDTNAILTSNPDLPLIHALGLLSLYYLSTGHVQRAWSTVSIALRLGMVMKLHLKKDGPEVWHSRIDAESMAWWSLRSLDTLLSSITGQPSTISDRDCNLPLPRSFSQSEARQRSVEFLQINLKINIVAQWALSSLYSINAASLPDPTIQERISRLTGELERLLPAIQDRERLILHFNWFYTMILVTRPCLSHISTRSNTNIAPSPGVFNLAKQCIHAAHGLVHLFPEQPSETIFRNGPWWCLTYYIMQAMDILILGLQEHNISTTESNTAESIEKLVRWLRWMQPRDIMAQRALIAVESLSHTIHNFPAGLFQRDIAVPYVDDTMPRWDLETADLRPTYIDDGCGIESVMPSIEPAICHLQPQPPLPQAQLLPNDLTLPNGDSTAWESVHNLWYV